jgi:hypothetical protein
VGLLATSAACGSGSNQTSISTARYDRACTTVADCVLAYDGPTNCCGVGCANSVIAERALATYMSDLASAEAHSCIGTSGGCSGGPATGGGGRGTVTVCPGPGRVDCVSGVCVFEMPEASASD